MAEGLARSRILNKRVLHSSGFSSKGVNFLPFEQAVSQDLFNKTVRNDRSWSGGNPKSAESPNGSGTPGTVTDTNVLVTVRVGGGHCLLGVCRRAYAG